MNISLISFYQLNYHFKSLTPFWNPNKFTIKVSYIRLSKTVQQIGFSCDCDVTRMLAGWSVLMTRRGIIQLEIQFPKSIIRRLT